MQMVQEGKQAPAESYSMAGSVVEAPVYPSVPYKEAQAYECSQSLPSAPEESNNTVTAENGSLWDLWFATMAATVSNTIRITSCKGFWKDYGSLMGAGACVAMIMVQPRHARQSMNLVTFMTMVGTAAAGGRYFGKHVPLVLCAYAGVKAFTRVM